MSVLIHTVYVDGEPRSIYRPKFSRVRSEPAGKQVRSDFAYCVECSGYVTRHDHAQAGHRVIHGPEAIRQSARMKLHRILTEAGFPL